MVRGIVLTFVVAALTGLWVLIPSELQAVGPDRSQRTADICRRGPLDRPRADCAPPVLPSTGNPYEDCVRRINQLRRVCQCLPPLTRWRGGERCANKHARYDSKKGIHAGFNDHLCKPQGSAQNECPAWVSTEQVVEGCLQAMWDEGPGKRFSKHGHYTNMSSVAYQQVACGFAKASDGEVWSVQNFR